MYNYVGTFIRLGFHLLFSSKGFANDSENTGSEFSVMCELLTIVVVGFFSVFVGFFLSGEWGMGFIPPPTMHLSCDNSCQGDEGKSSLCENKTLLLSV